MSTIPAARAGWLTRNLYRRSAPVSSAAHWSAIPLRLAVLFALLAVGWRLVDLTEWPFPFHPTVQYESALAARTIWLTLDPAARTPDMAAWLESVRFRHIVSPPVLPGLVAGCYLIAGEEIPWISKIFAALFWVSAGGFVFGAVVRQTGSQWSALAAGAWFLFTSFGLLVSRSFQTEPVLVLGFAAAIWWLSGSGRTLTWNHTITAALWCGIAALAKPGILLPPLAAGFTGWLVSPEVGGRFLRKAAHAAVFSGLLALPSAAYVLVMLNGRGAELQPHRLIESAFYSDVVQQIQIAVDLPALGLGLIGIALSAYRRNFLLPGLLAGYAAYVGIFTYHCSTHSYYHVPLLVLVAVGIGSSVATVGDLIARFEARWAYARLALPAAATLLFAAYLQATRLAWVGPSRYSPTTRAALENVAARDEDRANRYRAAREAVRPAGHVVAVTEEYGYPMEYHTGLIIDPWPQRPEMNRFVKLGSIDPAFTADRLLSRLQAKGHRFVVVTDFHEYRSQPQLAAALERRARVILSQPNLLVFELRPDRPADEPK